MCSALGRFTRSDIILVASSELEAKEIAPQSIFCLCAAVELVLCMWMRFLKYAVNAYICRAELVRAAHYLFHGTALECNGVEAHL